MSDAKVQQSKVVSSPPAAPSTAAGQAPQPGGPSQARVPSQGGPPVRPQPSPAATQARPVPQKVEAYRPAKKLWTPKRTRIPVQLNGVLYVTGLKATGKSGMAVKVDYPENVALLDWEDKGEAYAKQLGLGLYVNMNQRAEAIAESPLNVRMQHQYQVIIDVVKEIIDDPHYTVIVFDTADHLQKAYDWELRANFPKYGITQEQLKPGWGGIWPEVSEKIGQLFSFLRSYGGVKVICIVEHLSNWWDKNSGIIPDKYKLPGVKVFFRLSTLQLITVADKPGNIAALVKAENMPSTSPESLTISRCLPMRLPTMSWEAIYKYLEKPADLTEPKEGEVWSEEEVSMYGDKLTADQRAHIKLSMEALIARSKLEEGAGE